jgi:hypothetical protein
MSIESKPIKCDLCGSEAIIKYAQIPVFDANTYIGGHGLPDWSRIIECRSCGTRQQNALAKFAWNNRN